MKIYIASTAPGNEQHHPNGMLNTPRRLLSYHTIRNKQFDDFQVFWAIKKIKEKKNENILGGSGAF